MFETFKNRAHVAAALIAWLGIVQLAQAQLAPVTPSITIVAMQPPAPITEIKPRHTGGQIWIPGFWNWNGRTFIWQAGHFDHERRGQVYVPAMWEPVGQGWALIPGHWVASQ
jgi:hypothetical protein